MMARTALVLVVLAARRLRGGRRHAGDVGTSRRQAVDVRRVDVAAAQLRGGGGASAGECTRPAGWWGRRAGRSRPSSALRPGRRLLDDALGAARADPGRGSRGGRRHALRDRRLDGRRERRTPVYAYDRRRTSGASGRRFPSHASTTPPSRSAGRCTSSAASTRARSSADVFVYDPAADAGRRSTPLPAPNHAFDAVVFDGEIWMIGGRRGDEVLRDVWILTRRPGVGGRGRRCRSRWSSSARPSPGRDPRRLGEHLPDLRRGARDLARRPRSLVDAPRPARPSRRRGGHTRSAAARPSCATARSSSASRPARRANFPPPMCV